MLPDYPKIKAKLAEVCMHRIEQTERARLGELSRVRSTVLHEGDTHAFVREDGSMATMKMKRLRANASLKINLQELEKAKPADLVSMLDDLGESLAEQKARQFLTVLDDACESVGNVVRSESTVEQILQSMEKAEASFDDDGNVQPMSVIASDEQWKRIQVAMREIEKTPALRRRYQNAAAKQREQWRDREAARNLVD
jgi:hypothetical protein